MKRGLAFAPALALLAGLGGCGGGSSPSSASPTSPITRAILLVTQPSVGLVGLSPSPIYTFRLRLPVEVRVTNYTTADLNYARLRLFRAGAEIERAEVTADDIVTLAGTNHVTNDRSLAFTIVFEFNSSDFDNATILLGATDASGNSVDTVLGNLQIELDPSLQ